MTKENKKRWREELPIVLWAHRTTKSQATGASPLSLIYGTEVVIPIDLVRIAVKLAEISGVPKEDISEIVEEKRNNTASHNCLYQASMKAKLKKESFKWENLFGK